MEGLAGKVKELLGHSRYLKIDEIPYPMGDKTKYVWVCLGDGCTVSVTAAEIRNAAALLQDIPRYA